MHLHFNLNFPAGMGGWYLDGVHGHFLNSFAAAATPSATAEAYSL